MTGNHNDATVTQAGGCNAVRGAKAPAAELRYIYENSNSIGLVVESTELLKELLADDGAGAMPLRSDWGSPKFVIVLYSEGLTGDQIASSLQIPELGRMKVT
jgi:hypothetical protein